MKNIVDAVVTLIKRNVFSLTYSNVGNNRANSRGDALELYVKNLFAKTFDSSETERLAKWSEIFSYFGNATNPPDFMLKAGDAVEVKKIESADSALAFNSRIRGMWHIENPWRVFNYVYTRDLQAEFNFMCIINLEKWTRLDDQSKLIELQRDYPDLKITDVKIKNPDNPCKLKDAKLICYKI